LHDIGVVLDFREKTITIDSILSPMRNIVNLRIKPSVRILDAKYYKADLPEIVRTSCPHLTPSERDMLLSLLLDYESLFAGTLGDWNRPPASIELKDGAKSYHGRPYHKYTRRP